MVKPELPTDWKQAAFAGPGQEPFTVAVIPGLVSYPQLSPELTKAMQEQARAMSKPNEDGLIIVDVQHDFTPTSALEVSSADVPTPSFKSPA